MKINHFDRNIIVKSGKVIKPTIYNVNSCGKYEWTSIICDLDAAPFAKAQISDETNIKSVIEEGQLKDENISGFLIKGKETYFYKENIDILLKNKKGGNSVLYYKSMDNILLQCIEEEGLPDMDNPMINGDLYIKFNIIFPEKINIDNKILIEGGFNEPLYKIIDEIDTDLEVYELTDKNPNISYGKFKEVNVKEEVESIPHPGQNMQQCAQQ